MLDVEVIDDPAAAVTALDPIRSRLLAELGEPASAAALATRTGLTRQKINYHLRALENRGLVVAAGERRWGGLRERLLVASASSYVVSPGALGEVGADPGRTGDRLSASYLIALAARAVREVGGMWRLARDTDKRLATLSIDTAIRFRTPAERSRFTEDLSDAVTALAARYHDETAEHGRTHRLVLVAYPMPTDT
ncbi:ArsR/SmtB family transcription factor [Mycolicibacterium arenosum]|uniref:Helix-turn-helix domain-containing protein n=1 Tax=Mycolicibacterium arenosum TaxID=2952157 RepID=A0ABT1M1R5_9MYCO|nr:helix-turn-helix domain-containing protein [Mycolicibacterium sp. CAU 1645]MCP9272219.1 helix-turn-helix domain-containing protein [Mycolicibacterium sp. CAU 1645]